MASLLLLSYLLLLTYYASLLFVEVLLFGRCYCRCLPCCCWCLWSWCWCSCFPTGLASLLLTASYAVAVYPFALLQASFLLITTPLLLASIPSLRPFCCLRSFVAIVLLFLSALHHIDDLATVSISIVHAFCGVLFVDYVPAVAGITCFCICPCCCMQSL